jgi:hypothetical protein
VLQALTGFLFHLLSRFAFSHRAVTAARACSLVRALRSPLALPPFRPKLAMYSLTADGILRFTRSIYAIRLRIVKEVSAICAVIYLSPKSLIVKQLYVNL